jgi:uncharacterized DUF497 family protein
MWYVLSIVQDANFEWDDAKAARNERDHDVSFVEACGVFSDANRVEYFDDGHSDDEARYSVIGFSRSGRLLFVTFTIREPRMRIIHAHIAERDEEQIYEENN